MPHFEAGVRSGAGIEEAIVAVSKIGELLKARGLLDDAQIQDILKRQAVTGQPFGAVAAELFGVQEAELWRAWAQQMIESCPRVYPRELQVDPAALNFVNAREAWAYRLLPVQWTSEDVTLVTTAERLPNAMAYAQIKSRVPAIFVLADLEELEEVIREKYNITEATLAA